MRIPLWRSFVPQVQAQVLAGGLGVLRREKYACLVAAFKAKPCAQRNRLIPTCVCVLFVGRCRRRRLR
jgi:hypothetical protein